MHAHVKQFKLFYFEWHSVGYANHHLLGRVYFHCRTVIADHAQHFLFLLGSNFYIFLTSVTLGTRSHHMEPKRHHMVPYGGRPYGAFHVFVAPYGDSAIWCLFVPYGVPKYHIGPNPLFHPSKRHHNTNMRVPFTK